jgi:hypothetical protein
VYLAVGCRIDTYIIRCIFRLPMHGIDIYHAWAFCVVRLDDLGNAKASKVGWAKRESHAPFVEAQLSQCNLPILWDSVGALYGSEPKCTR